MSRWSQYADRMPTDNELLEPLGVLAWAAVRLHAVVRDALRAIDIAIDPSSSPLDYFRGRTLGQVVAHLEQERAPRLVDEERDALQLWCAEARTAVRRRNDILHGIPYTAEDGKQAIRYLGQHFSGRLDAGEVIDAAGQLVHAASGLPRGPFTAR